MGADKEGALNNKSEVTLCFTSTDLCFHCGPVSLSVSPDFSRRSKLLSDLRQDNESANDVPLSLPFDALKAWLAFLEGRQSDKSSETACSLSDTQLLQALEAADFLQDQGASTLIASSLAHALEPSADAGDAAGGRPKSATAHQAGHGSSASGAGPDNHAADSAAGITLQAVLSTHLGLWGSVRAVRPDTSPALTNPSAAQKARALKILLAAPARTIPDLLAAVHPHPHSTARFEHDTQRAHAVSLWHLFQLLPMVFHPAVLHARFPSIKRDHAITFPEPPTPPRHSPESQQPPCMRASSKAVQAVSFFANYSSTNPPAPSDGAGVEVANASYGTQPDRLSIPESLKRWHDLIDTRSQSRKRPRRSQRLNTQCPLDLLFADDSGADNASSGGDDPEHSGDDVHSERAGADGEGVSAKATDGDEDADDTALRQKMREMFPGTPEEIGGTVTRLSLSIEPYDSDVLWMILMLQLRGLRELTLSIHTMADMHADGLCRTLHFMSSLTALHLTTTQPAHIDLSSEPSPQLLLSGISMLPHLAALSLERCFYTHASWHRWREPIRPDETLDQLSRLTGLTHLSLRDNLIRRRDVCVKLGKALRRLKLLKQLSLANIEDGMHYAFEVWIKNGIPDLEALNLGCFRMNELGMLAQCMVRTAHATGVTALALDHGTWLPEEEADEIAKLFAPLPQAFPALRHLSMRHSGVRDGGLSGLASVLPQLTALDSLDVGFNDATHTGVLALLAAAHKLHRGESGGLRRLGIACAAVGPKHAAEVAGLLAQLPALEEVDIAGLELGGHGVRATVEALAGLPHLCGLNISDNGQTAVDVEAAVPLLAGLKSLRWLVMHEVEGGEVAAVRAAVEGAAPWLDAITLGRARVEVEEIGRVVVWGSSWVPWSPAEPWM